MNSTIGLVTVLFKSDEVLEGFFRSVSLQTHKDYILYLVDNSPNELTNQLIDRLSQSYPVTRVYHLPSSGNIGVAAGNNVGIKAAMAEGCGYVLILNNDIEIEQNHVFATMLSLCQSKNESMVVPKIYYYGTRKIWMAGGYMDHWRALGVHFGDNKPDGPAYNIGKKISYAPTCFMIIDRKVFEKIGFMDEKYFAYYDDVDFDLRATRNGYHLFYEPSIYILHKVSFSTGTASPFYVYYSNRNKIYFIKKNFKGIRRYFAICYTLVSRVAFYIKYDSVRRKKLVQGLRDGFKIQVTDN